MHLEHPLWILTSVQPPCVHPAPTRKPRVSTNLYLGQMYDQFIGPDLSLLKRQTRTPRHASCGTLEKSSTYSSISQNFSDHDYTTKLSLTLVFLVGVKCGSTMICAWCQVRRTKHAFNLMDWERRPHLWPKHRPPLTDSKI